MKTPKTKKLNRREFVAGGTGIGILASAGKMASSPAGPQVISRGVKPVVVSAANGNRSKDDAGITCVARAFNMITAGSDVLDACIAGVNIVELDPNDTSVGYGGLPNAEGVVQLDASVMHGPKKMGGSVACLEGVRTPSLVAKKLMEETDHVLIVGKDAQKFARNMGFTIEDDLNTPKSRELYLEWRRRTDPEHYIPLKERAALGWKVALEMVAEGKIDPDHVYGTINCNGVNSKGEVCGTTTTSGLAWKIPGRVGDSPILGAGLYVDGEIGAAGSTGRGEANLLSLASFLIVECMRQGMHPKDAGMTALKRIKSQTIAKRLLNSRGNPNFGVNFYILNVKGEYAGVTMYNADGKATYAVCTEKGPENVRLEPLLAGSPNS
jgi:N4-(beta-N-acetylglucosaminyl)-L-asparaginase